MRSKRPNTIVLTLLGLTMFAITIPLLSPIGRVYAMPDTTVQGYAWRDTNCDGIRQSAEQPVINLAVHLFAAGEDEVINNSDDQVISVSGTGPTGKFAFDLGTTGLDYALVILQRDQPAGMIPGPLNPGDDRTSDNDMRAELWATNGFQMSETETITGIDIGLCALQLTPRLYMPAIWR